MKLDETEIKILTHLQKEGRLSRRVLAERIEVSTPTISSKIEKLENMGIIRGFSVEIDHGKMGLQKYYFKVKAQERTEEEMREVFEGSELFRKMEKLEGSGYLITLFINDFNQLDMATEYIEEKDGLSIEEVWRTQDEETKVPKIPLDENVSLDIACYYCGKPIEGEPEKWKKDGKEHYFCCSSCKGLYEEKYERLQKRKKEMKEER